MERALSSARSVPQNRNRNIQPRYQEGSRRQWNSNWASDLLSSSGRYPHANREGNGQSYGEGNEESDSDRNGLSNLRGNCWSNGAGNRPSNRRNYLPGCGEGNGQGNEESNRENDPAGKGLSDPDRNWEGCGGDGGGDFAGYGISHYAEVTYRTGGLGESVSSG